MSNGIGPEHPYQQIKDGEAAARLALDEVMKLTHERAQECCAYNPNYPFGSWYSHFLGYRRMAEMKGRTFSREAGEARITKQFHHSPPSPEEIAFREAEAIEDRRRFEERITANRERTGCSRDDGLYRIKRYTEGCPIALMAHFVDESSVTIEADGEARFAIRPCLYAPTPSMAEKWYHAEGRQVLQMDIEERVAIEDIDQEIVLVYTRARRFITVSQRLSKDKQARLVDMAREISKDHLKLRGDKAVVLIHNDINDERVIFAPRVP
jgi:hypothetical protein